MKKYKLTKKTIIHNGIKLFQIKALKTFGNVKKNDLGGYIEKMSNLSQCGDAWVYGDAQVYEDAQVFGDAQVYGNARVYGDAQVYENAWVFGNARVYGNVRVSVNAQVSGNTWVFGNVWVSGNARVYRNAQVSGGAEVSGNACIKNRNDIISVIIPNCYNVTVTPQNVSIGCRVFTRHEILKITKKQAIELGMSKEYYSHYKNLIKNMCLFVKSK